MTVEEIVERVRTAYEAIDERLMPGCDSAEVERLRREVRAKFKLELPIGYLQLLQLSNGFGHDGYAVYASRPVFYEPDDEEPCKDGLIEANQGMAVDGVAIPDGLCLGYGDDYVFGMQRDGNGFHQYDAAFLKRLRSFASFEEMFGFMFESRLPDPPADP